MLIELKPAQKYRILDFKIKDCKLLNSTAIASGYAGRDPQGGTNDRSVQGLYWNLCEEKRRFFFVLRNENEKELGYS